MPRFHMTGEHLPEFKALDPFTRGYIEAMFWTNTGNDDDELNGLGFQDLDPEALHAITRVCHRFQTGNANDLAFALDFAQHNYTLEHAGMDFWLTRNGHGAGFCASVRPHPSRAPQASGPSDHRW